MNNKFSINTQTQITQKLIYIDNRIANFSQYQVIIYILLILSSFSIMGSIYDLSSNDNIYDQRDPYIQSRTNKKAFDIINFFINIFHIAGYVYGIQAYTKQQAKMNKMFEYAIIGFFASNFFYFFIFIFLYHVTFFTWCIDIFYLIMNITIFYTAQELTNLFKEKEEYKIKYDNLVL